MTEPNYTVYFRNGLIRFDSVAGDHVGFTETFPLGRRRKLKTTMWWEGSTADAVGLVEWADAHQLSVDPQVRQYADQLWRVESRRVSLATAIRPGSTPVPAVTGLQSSMLETQKVIVAASPQAWFDPPGQNTIRHRAVLLADDQGLGKTLTALAILRVATNPCHRAVIVCPTSLTQNWVNEVAEHFTEGTFNAWVATGKTPSPIPETVDTVVIGWEILADWAETLIGWAPDAVIADEGHYVKSGKQQMRRVTQPKKVTVERPKTQEVTRTKVDTAGNPVKNAWGEEVTETIEEPVLTKDGVPMMRKVKETARDAQGNIIKETVQKAVSGSARATAILNIGQAVSANHGLIMPMTGTPIVNRPLELQPLIELSGIEKEFVSDTQFKERFCGPQWKKIRGGKTTKEYKGATNLLELNTRLLTSGVYFRRTKKVLVDQGLLRPKYVDKVYAYDYETKPSPWRINPSPEEQAEYESAKGETTEFFQDIAQRIAAEKSMGVNTVAVQKKVAAEGAKNLKQIAELRQATARLKVPHIINQVQKLIDRGEKVVVVAHHREVVDAYAEAFGGLKIQGDMGAKAIEKSKALFNGTPVDENPVMVLSVEAGKTGHTLCKQTIEGVGPACAYMIFAEQIWTPGDESQAQDRIWRIGQDREVHISNALLRGSIDEQIYGQRLKKRWVFNAVIDSIDQESMDTARDEKSGAGELARQLVYGLAS